MKKSSSEKRRHVVAWINKAEWDQVSDYSYSKDPASQRFASQRISAWRARYGHSTPVAVDCTADSVRCQASDRSGQSHGDDSVSLYGAASVRFVNSITERRQGMKARPSRQSAGKSNIPEWVVDSRHDFTHKKSPTSKWCRKGCKVVSDWLQQEYWSRQSGGADEKDWESPSDGEEEEEAASKQQQENESSSRQKEMQAYKAARDFLISYEKERYQSSDGSQEDKWSSPLADMSWLSGDIKQFSSDCSDSSVDVSLEDGFLVPTAEQSDTSGCDPSDEPSPSEPRLPPVFSRFWSPSSKMLSSPSFIHSSSEKSFAESKVSASKRQARRSFFISAWASESLLCNSNKCEYRFERKGQKKARMKERIFSQRIQSRWQQSSSACSDAPCVSTPHSSHLISDDMEHPSPQDTQQKSLQLCSIYTQTSSVESSLSREQKHQPVYTSESSHEKQRSSRPGSASAESSSDSQQVHVSAEKAKSLRGSPWQVCPDKVQWKNFPSGKVPGQPDDPSCLMAETYSTSTVSDQPVESESSRGQNVPGVSGPARTTEGLSWNPSDVSRLKSGLKSF